MKILYRENDRRSEQPTGLTKYVIPIILFLH